MRGPFLLGQVLQPPFLFQPHVEYYYLDEIKEFQKAVEGYGSYGGVLSKAEKQGHHYKDGYHGVGVGAHGRISACSCNCLLGIHVNPDRCKEGHHNYHLSADSNGTLTESSVNHRNNQCRGEGKAHHYKAEYCRAGKKPSLLLSGFFHVALSQGFPKYDSGSIIDSSESYEEQVGDGKAGCHAGDYICSAATVVNGCGYGFGHYPYHFAEKHEGAFSEYFLKELEIHFQKRKQLYCKWWLCLYIGDNENGKFQGSGDYCGICRAFHTKLREEKASVDKKPVKHSVGKGCYDSYVKREPNFTDVTEGTGDNHGHGHLDSHEEHYSDVLYAFVQNKVRLGIAY